MYRHLPKVFICSAPSRSHSFRRVRSRLSACVACLRWLSTGSLIGPDNIVRSHLPDINLPTNVPFHQFMFEKCDQYKSLVAVEDYLSGQKYSFGHLKEKSMRVASALHRLGYCKGDAMAVYSCNQIDYTVLLLACAANGLWFSAINPSSTPDELRRHIVHSGSKAVFATPNCVASVSKALKLVKPQESQVKDLFVFGSAEGFRPFQTLLDDDGRKFPDVDINPLDDVFILPYSSGTTGLPKGVMLTHYNCMANCLQIASSIPTTPDDRALGLLPMFHIYGMVVVQLSVILGGASVVYLPKFVPETFLQCLQDKHISLAHLVPPLVLFLSKMPSVSQYNLKSLKRVICGAAPLGVEVTLELLKKLDHGITVNQATGMPELSPVFTIDTTSTPGSAGHFVVNTLGKIVDTDTHEPLGAGGVGEICVKGPQIMKGYFKDKQTTDSIIDPDGWIHTGDIGHVSPDGLLYIQDRLKELIKYKGFAVAPAELEALLLGHPDVQDVAVLGVPSEECGELPKAFVVKKPGSKVQEHELVKYIEDRTAYINRLRGGVQFIEDIPKSPSGKILRRVLRQTFL
ncbi:4-coumarate--CoA ligase 5 [Biomphalaria pfeifferi]|uniref:4-coumarate--CoA ligase 5 n=1 Tax=Biomphalaria pfeifferi TaxID=112525 RepID=A0AAD8BB66_BIOPF|nr:4-coumarate--CoA ligase 5 [Biomphalaria pfeifferi]